MLGLPQEILYLLPTSYFGWLQWTESMNDRRKALRENIVGLEVGPGNPAQVKQIDVVNQSNGVTYKIQKSIPYLRELDGETVLTIQFLEFGSREYLWAEDDLGEGFNSYLQEVAKQEYPELEIVRPELDSDSVGSILEVTLRIETVDVEEVERTVSKIVEFRNYYYNNYIGDARCFPPY